MISKRIALSLATFIVAATSAAGTARAADTSADRPDSYAALLELKPMDAMHLVDVDGKGHVTREDFMKFQQQIFERIDSDHDGRATAEEWVGRPLTRAQRER
jgi:EF hand domain-containing protein